MNQSIDTQEEAPFLIRTIINNAKSAFAFIMGQWKILAKMGVVGALLGLSYAAIKKDTYTAITTFVVEDNKAAGGGGIASALAGQFGVDLGSMGGSGVLQGDNVLLLLKSQSLIKKALLTAYDSSNQVSLADVYSTNYGYKTKWANSKEVGRVVNFTVNNTKNTRLEDSLLHIIIKRITEKELSITKPDKKLSLFSLQITNRNEQLSSLLCERLLKVTADFYIHTKTKRIRGNVERLQQRVDSIKAILDRKTYTAIGANRDLLDANPAFSQNNETTVEISGRDKIVQATVFAELTKNLEASKTTLLQETPTIQVVDTPELPLKKNETSWILSLLLGAIALKVITIVGLFLFKSDTLKK